jgi:type IX secretion system PorP/SprF family membrane protein
MKTAIVIVGWLCFCLPVLRAQDLHFTQFYLHSLALTPAATGMFHGDLRASAIYRSQWRNVPVAYETFGAAADWKCLERQNNLVSVGFLLEQDKAGDGGLSWFQAGATASVAHALNDQHALSLGFGLSVAQRQVNIGALSFKNQWNGDAYDPNLSSGESFNRNSSLVPTLAAGVQWHFVQNESRTRMDVGGGVSHVNKPVVSLGDFDEKLDRRISFFENAILQIHERHDLVIFSSWQQMAKAKELLFGAGIRRILTTGIANETAVQFSCGLRMGDAILPAIQVERNNWTVGLSYDVNISAFETATRGRGGMEIAVIWRRIPVPLPNAVKSCPVF